MEARQTSWSQIQMKTKIISFKSTKSEFEIENEKKE